MNEASESHRSFSNYSAIFVLFGLLLVPALSINSASAQNPWFEGSRPLIDEGNQVSSDKNLWSEKQKAQSADAIDESKYPPLEEDKTLGMGLYGQPEAELTKVAPSSLPESSQSIDPQSPGEVPVYPGSSQRSMPGHYSNRAYPSYRPGYQPGYQSGYQSGYQPGYQPGYQSGSWPGDGGMGGFPFGGNSANGFPFGGNSNGLPFGMGNGWMPNSGTGFW